MVIPQTEPSTWAETCWEGRLGIAQRIRKREINIKIM